MFDPSAYPPDPLPTLKYRDLAILREETLLLSAGLSALARMRRNEDIGEIECRRLGELPDLLAFFGSKLLDLAGREDGLPLKEDCHA